MINLADATASYYLCNGVTFQSKIQACIYSQTTKKPLEWIFGLDEVYSKYPWDVEPTESLDELYDRRARELREQYDYLILSYSGGADSHNVLMSFYRQGLIIDEVLTNHLTKATESTTILNPTDVRAENYNAEHQLNVVDKLKWIKDHMPKTKITEIDMSDTILHALDGKDESWVTSRKEFLSVGALNRVNYFYLSEVKKKFDKGKTVALILGMEKPRTFIQNGDLILAFSDTALCSSSPDEFNLDYSNVNIEPFYWAASTAPLICKQVHTIKRFIETSPGKKYFWEVGSGYSFDIARSLHERWLRPLLYSTWNNTWYQANKSRTTWNSEFDKWWRDLVRGTNQEVLWNKGLAYVDTHAGDYVIYRDNKPDGLKTFSKNYKIGKVK